MSCLQVEDIFIIFLPNFICLNPVGFLGPGNETKQKTIINPEKPFRIFGNTEGKVSGLVFYTPKIYVDNIVFG